jgi:hypothetical protein
VRSVRLPTRSRDLDRCSTAASIPLRLRCTDPAQVLRCEMPPSQGLQSGPPPAEPTVESPACAVIEAEPAGSRSEGPRRTRPSWMEPTEEPAGLAHPDRRPVWPRPTRPFQQEQPGQQAEMTRSGARTQRLIDGRVRGRSSRTSMPRAVRSTAAAISATGRPVAGCSHSPATSAQGTSTNPRLCDSG